MAYKSTNDRHNYFTWCSVDKLIKSLCIHKENHKRKFQKHKRQRKSSSLSKAQDLINKQTTEHDNISLSKEILNTFMNLNNESGDNNNNNTVRQRFNALKQNDIVRKDFTDDDIKYIQCIHHLNEIVNIQTSNQNNISKSGTLFKKFDTNQMIIYEIVYATNLLTKALMRMRKNDLNSNEHLSRNTRYLLRAHLNTLDFEDCPGSCDINVIQEHPAVLVNNVPALCKAEQNILITIEDINPIEATQNPSKMKDQLTNSSLSNHLNLPSESHQSIRKKSRSSYGDTDIYSESTNISIFIPYDDTTLQKYNLKTTQNSTTLYTFEEMISDYENIQQLDSFSIYSEKFGSNNESKEISVNKTEIQNDSEDIIKKHSTFISQNKRQTEHSFKTKATCQNIAKIPAKLNRRNLSLTQKDKEQNTSAYRTVHLSRIESARKSVSSTVRPSVSKEKVNASGSYSNKVFIVGSNREERSLSKNPQKRNSCKRHQSEVIRKLKNLNTNKVPFK
ncbi:unnamed protein product [Trichobilharzia regenti]|nr:unnamed protein product [Trichobilharzia regenti]